MNYLVFVKVVKGELSPFDEAALEIALRMREKSGGKVSVVTMAPGTALDRMRALTRLGVDESILLSDKAFAGSDTAATSYILSLAAKRIQSDLILCGRQSMDGDTAQVGVSLAARLGIDCLTNVMREPVIENGRLTAETRLGTESVSLPALLTIERIAKLRFPPMRAKPGIVQTLDAKALRADTKRCGLAGSPTRVIRSFESERGKRHCEFLSKNELFAKIDELRALPPEHENIKKSNFVKLPEVFAVGADVAKIASEIAGSVITLERLEPDEYLKIISEKKPSVVLFPSDLWGRRTAPYVATKLETGLCADCTLLETDGERLFMYRPAFGGNITAKIVCDRNPQMATVRTLSESSEIIVSAGLGVKNDLERVKKLALSLGADPGASRGLVDAGLAPYEWQVGLTGKTVAPKIYLALGISGAIHHMSGITGSRFILGINPDKNAPVFDWCDYGCIDVF